MVIAIAEGIVLGVLSLFVIIVACAVILQWWSLADGRQKAGVWVAIIAVAIGIVAIMDHGGKR